MFRGKLSVLSLSGSMMLLPLLMERPLCAAPYPAEERAIDRSASAEGQTEPPVSQTSAAQEPVIPSNLLLTPGQVQTVAVSEVGRVAIGDPAIVDVTILSPTQILVQAKKTGSTNLILWDAQGQHQVLVRVADTQPQTTSEEVVQLLRQLNLPSIRVELKGGKIFLLGEVANQDQMGSLEQLASAFPGVTSLVRVVPSPPPPPPSPVHATLVQLAVQLIEINRSDLERLGVKWSEGVSLTDAQLSDVTTTKALFHWGTSLTRTSVMATLNALIQQNKARILAEPKLVTSSGKEASSFIGVEVPVIQSTSFGTGTGAVTASIEFRKTGVLLKMTPNVSADQRITITLEAEVSEIDVASGLTVPVGNQAVLVPGFNVRKASTEVTTASGEAIFIAGLLQVQDTEGVSRVPALGSVPVIGRLFRSPETKSTRRELIIVVTPELSGETEATIEKKAVAQEQALAVAEATPSIEDPTLRYALKVQNRIAQSIQYPMPEKERGVSGQVKLRLHLFRDGTLEQAVIAKPSGVESLDLEALEAAQRQSPYPPFPSELAQQDLWLELQVLFRP